MIAMDPAVVSTAEIEAMLPYVHALVYRGFSLANRGIAPEDLVQAGMEGVCKAARRWRPDGGASFRGFAYLAAHGAIRDYLRTESPGGRFHVGEYTLVSIDARCNPHRENDYSTAADSLVETVEESDPLLRSGVRAVVATMPPREQRAYRLTVEHEMPLRAAGELMGVSESRVCQLVGRVRRRLADDPVLAEYRDAA